MKTLKKQTATFPDGVYRKKHCKPKIIGLFLDGRNDNLIRKVSLSLTQAISYFHIITFDNLNEASQGLDNLECDLLITDSESYYNYVVSYSPALFKIKIEKSFFSSSDNLELESRPYIYESDSNTIKIRRKSIENTRFLYEIFNVVLNSPTFILNFSGSSESSGVIKKFYKMVNKDYPYIDFELNIENIVTESIFDIDILFKKNKGKNKIIQMRSGREVPSVPHRISFLDSTENYLKKRSRDFSEIIGDLLKSGNYIDFLSD